ncbi:4'-phosphopantetheine phosphatase [Planococcus citri]|uniref:4'-phosphopantetheine phosphatase n=1 Tax=Planococcus citri TaxID=170843 RepID=UPI0031F96F50
MSAKETVVSSITLPDNIQVFRNLKTAKRFAIDIGGSLTKIAYYSIVQYRRPSILDRTSESSEENFENEQFTYTYSEGARLHFVKFETKYIAECLNFIGAHLVNSHDEMKGKCIKATGGGAHKYADLIQEKLGLSVDKEDELPCLIKGCNFLLKNISDEAFVYHRNGNPEYEFQTAHTNIFPYLLVNIGSGVSILKVESEEKYERIGGTATGGGTFWGLGSLLTKAKGFDELLLLAEKGDHRKVDLLVRDIYGGDCTKSLGLPPDIIASSFGKVCQRPDNQEAISKEDLARSLLFTISNDIGQIASLYAMMNNLKKVYFGGYFLRNHPLSMHTISYSINYWSRGSVQSLFLRHEGYLGAIGAFLKGAEEWDGDQYSWLENYAGSSGLRTGSVMLDNNVLVHQLELDRWEPALTYCPLLKNPADYVPDTVDLNSDQEAREYWLKCFEEKIDTFVRCAIASQPENSTAQERAEMFKDKYITRLHHLKIQPFAYGNLTVRSLLDTIEHYLREFDFPDPFLLQRQQENEYALMFLLKRLQELDVMEFKPRQVELIVGFLAGNIFDWGAKEVAKILESQEFGFQEARSKIPPRPWLVDNLDRWIERMQTQPYQKVAIFVDNSGADIVLGVIPFARELLKHGTKIVLCANSAPALNDVTQNELIILVRKISVMCPIIEEAYNQKNLIIMENAQAGPCLDLSRLGKELAEEMETVDLIVIEGMGRAVHTNLDAEFNCDSLKIAVIKNTWLANRLGGKMFSVICKYESSTD